MNASSHGGGQAWPTIEPGEHRRINEEALKQCGGDAALWFHYRAVFEGKYRARQHSKEAWASWRRSKLLPQYEAAEKSVVEGWRKFLENTWRLPRARQTDPLAINRAMILLYCRRAKDKEQASEILKERATSIGMLAEVGDVDFFKNLGRVLSSPPRSTRPEYKYAQGVLSNWLTSFLWLMPEKTAADCLVCWRGSRLEKVEAVSTELRHFKEIKRDYKLKAHKPSLISHIERNGELVATTEGRRTLGLLVSSTQCARSSYS